MCGRELSLARAKAELSEEFREIGVWDRRYYDARQWLRELSAEITLADIDAARPRAEHLDQRRPELAPERELGEVLAESPVKPQISARTLELLTSYQRLPSPPRLIALSSTTREFLELEPIRDRLGMVISTLDDFGIAGKPPAAYERAAELIGVASHKILHIGDDPVMDVESAEAAWWRTQLWPAE